jgi:putative membrane protein
MIKTEERCATSGVALQMEAIPMRHFLFVALAAILLPLVACSESSEKFIGEAIEGNLSEVQMGKLALSRSQSDAIKSYGDRLVQDHSAANLKARQVATQLGVTPPTEPNREQKSDYESLAKLSGRDFDREFAKHMVMDHKKDIAAFEKVAQRGDPAGAFAKETLPTLREHLRIAEQLQNSMASR